MNKLAAFLVAAIAIAGLPCLAAAQAADKPDLRARFQLNTFDQASTGEDGFALDHAAVLEALQFGFNLQVQVDDDPLVFQREEDGGYVETLIMVDRLIALHLGGAIGLFDYGQLAVHFPLYLDKGSSGRTGGIGDLRLIPKGAYRFDAGKADVGVAVLMPLGLPTGEPQNLTGAGGVSVEPGLALDLLLARLRLLLQAAYFWREEQRAEIVRGAALRFGAGAELQVVSHPNTLRVALEAEVTTQLDDPFGRDDTVAVLLGGLRYRFSRGIGLKAALGPGLAPGVGTPDFRVLVGIDYTYVRPEEAPAEITRVTERVDTDADGIPDDRDYCPDEPEDFDGFEDDDGCPEPDNDGDGVPDARDACPLDPENLDGFEDGDGCPERDTDGDGLHNRIDSCPSEAEDFDGFEDDDGCPDVDNDLDGVLDVDDACPLLPESIGGPSDEVGCPRFIRYEGGRIVFERKILFERRQAELRDSAYDVLDELTGAIIANPQWSEITIEVHGSGRGRAGTILELTERRAITLLRLLVAGGVVPDRLLAIGRGNERPLDDAATREGRNRNERVVITVSTKQEQEVTP